MSCLKIDLTKVAYFRSSQRCSVRKGVLRNFTKFRRKHLCQSLFFNFMKKETLAQVFSVNFAKFLRTPNTEHLSATASVILVIFQVRLKVLSTNYFSFLYLIYKSIVFYQQASIQARLSTAIFCQRFSFFTVFLVNYLNEVF